jgi:hypothetical protein
VGTPRGQVTGRRGAPPFQRANVRGTSLLTLPFPPGVARGHIRGAPAEASRPDGLLLQILAMDLSVLMDPLDLPRLAQVLNELGHPGRLDTVRGWDGDTMAKLYEAMKGYLPVTLETFVPPGVPPLTEVIHHGKNSLPAFTHFQKRFCKPEDRKDELWGYNENPALVLWFAGAGYYVAHGWDPGEIAIDYTMVPPGKVPAWPGPLEKNERGLGPRAVYGNMIDIMRGLSNHVSIGRAKRLKKPGKPESAEWMDAWFVLCREDVKAA